MKTVPYAIVTKVLSTWQPCDRNEGKETRQLVAVTKNLEEINLRYPGCRVEVKTGVELNGRIYELGKLVSFKESNNG